MKKILLLFLGIIVVVNPVVLSCTVFHASNETMAIGGNNEDHFNTDTHIYFYPPTDDEYGKVIVGYSGPYRVQGGMNEKGVFWDALSCPYHEVINSSHLPHYNGDIFEHILEVCETCDEANAILNQYNLEILEYAQVLIGDQYGDSFIIEGDVIHYKNKYYQVATNFLLSQYPNPPYPCWRYTTACAMFDSNGVDNLSVDFCASVLDAVHLEGTYPTQYSTVYDLKNQLIYLYYNHNFDQVKVFDLSEELQLGYHSYSIPALFEEPPNTPSRPVGSDNGKPGETYTYSTNTTDLYGDDVYYQWDWGDGGYSEWLGPYTSGETVEAYHVWDKKGTYSVKVKAKDVYNCESNWSDPLPIQIPTNLQQHSRLFHLLEKFSNAFPILRYLLKVPDS
jgi:hypothetical protein